MNFGIKHTYTSNQEIKNIVLPDGSKVICLSSCSSKSTGNTIMFSPPLFVKFV